MNAFKQSRYKDYELKSLFNDILNGKEEAFHVLFFNSNFSNTFKNMFSELTFFKKEFEYTEVIDELFLKWKRNNWNAIHTWSAYNDRGIMASIKQSIRNMCTDLAKTTNIITRKETNKDKKYTDIPYVSVEDIDFTVSDDNTIEKITYEDTIFNIGRESNDQETCLRNQLIVKMFCEGYKDKEIYNEIVQKCPNKPISAEALPNLRKRIFERIKHEKYI